MANLADIISRHWPAVNGQGAFLRLDLSDEAGRPLGHLGQYDTLAWNPVYPQPKPTLSEILAYEAVTDAWLAEREKQRLAWRDFRSERPDALLAAIETLAEAVADLGAGRTPKRALADLDAKIKAARTKAG